MKVYKIIVGIISIAVSLSGCGLHTSKDQIDHNVKKSIESEVPSLPLGWRDYSESGDIAGDWIASFADPTLENLVVEAQENNKNLQVAAANVERARALVSQAGAALQPNVDLIAGGGGSGILDNSKANTSAMNLGLQVSWELDIWGRLSAGQRSAVASAEAVQADYIYSQHSLAAATAIAYFIAIEIQKQTKIVGETVSSLLEISRIVDLQYENGMTTRQDVALARSDLASAKERLADIEGSKRNSTRALELLLGRYPQAELAVRETLPSLPPQPPAGLPSNLLERRPDIIAAERRVAAAFNKTAQAKAARLPSLGLTGSLGGVSNSLSTILNPANVTWQAGANLLAPVFDGGVRQAQVDIATAEQKQALASYGQAGLTAFFEVEQFLDQGDVLLRRQSQLTEALREARRAYNIAKIRYKEGETPLLDVLSLQQRVNTSESNLASVTRLLLEQRVNLYLALGGSW